MKPLSRNAGLLLGIGLAATLAVSGCHEDTAHIDTQANRPAQSGDESSADISLPAFTAGTRGVVLTGDPAANDGLAFVDESGRAFISLAPTSAIGDRVLYRRRDASSHWHRVPTSQQALTLSRELTTVAPVTPIDANAIAGRYQSVIGRDIATFMVDDAGTISAVSDGCQVAGHIDPADRLGGATSARLTLSGCSKTPEGHYDGWVFVDTEAVNAAWRFIGASNQQVIDIYTFAQDIE